ncbi:hypothetical protein FRC17_005911 [Serendipita sp. 399]|nr:hypothetical protein FRC17_005911 [Serendipita sp. 399]
MLSLGRYDHYELLGITQEAREKDINKAFRSKSLAVHPDRNPDNPEAAQKFHELKLAQQELLDPQIRAQLDTKLKSVRANAERNAKASAKRKGLLDALEESERAHKKSKTMTLAEKRRKEEMENEIMDEGRRLREEREKANAQMEEETRTAAESSSNRHEPPNTEIPVRLKYNLSKRPDLANESSIAQLLRQFGAIDQSLIKLSVKPPKGKPNAPPKFATAVIIFKKVEGAFGAVVASGQEARGLKDVEITWLGGEEPEYVKKLRDLGVLNQREKGTTDSNSSVPDPTLVDIEASKTARPVSTTSNQLFSRGNIPKTSSGGSDINFESVILMRMRQAERDRIARELEEAGE